MPAGAAIDFYYRTAQAGENITELNWIAGQSIAPVPGTAAGQFTVAQYQPGGKNGSLSPFQQAQMKFVMRGSEESPALRGLQIKYHAT